MITFCEAEPNRLDAARIGDLAYGTPFIYNGSRYIKVDKHTFGEGVGLQTPESTSAAMNMKLGTIRAIPDGTSVFVLDICAQVVPGVAAEHKKC